MDNDKLWKQLATNEIFLKLSHYVQNNISQI